MTPNDPSYYISLCKVNPQTYKLKEGQCSMLDQ